MTSAFAFALDDDRDTVLEDDDDDALQVALAFVDEFQAPSSSDSTSTDDGIASSPLHTDQHIQTGINNNANNNAIMKRQLINKRVSNALKRAVPGNASNRSRDGRKEELIYLRKKVSELELQLAERKAKKTRNTPEPRTGSVALQPLFCSAPPPPVATTQKPSATPSVWQEIGTRQYNQRVKAERENIRLKVVLENQLRIARSLEKVLQKTTCAKVPELLPEWSDVHTQALTFSLGMSFYPVQDFEKLIHGRPLPYSVRSSPVLQGSGDVNERQLYQELLAGLDQSYAEAEGVFQASGLARADSAYIDAVVRSDDSHGIQLEVVASKVLPFDMRTSGSVVWHHYAFAKERLPNRAYRHNSPQTLNATEDTIIEDFNLEVDINSAIALFHVKLVMRRYSEKKRVVIVWRAFFDPLCIADEPTPGVRFLERGYIVIKSAAAALTSSCSSDNVLQTCYISTPVTTGDLADADPAKVGTITDFVLSATAANISSSHEMIENVLLEHAIKANFGV